MPEGIEIEIYRRAADAVVGRRVASVSCFEGYAWGGASTDDVMTALHGATISGTRRIGKLLLLDGDQLTVGLRFGMTGRLLVDGDAPIGELLYSTTRPDPTYLRFQIEFAEGGSLGIVDPRRLGGVELEPDEAALGPDVFAIAAEELAPALEGGRGPLKARLLDQARVAGIGNLIADEALWRAGLAPTRPAGSLSADEIQHLAATLAETVALLFARGGSHTGDLQEQRHRDGVCPRDGVLLSRTQVGGRTTYWCGEHQV